MNTSKLLCCSTSMPPRNLSWKFVVGPLFTTLLVSDVVLIEGMKVHSLEPDDGSGWVKVADMTGDSGLVPATYLNILHAEPSGESTQSSTARRGNDIKAC